MATAAQQPRAPVKTASVDDFVIKLHLFSSFSAKYTSEVDFETPLNKLRSYHSSVTEDAIASELVRHLSRQRQAAVAALNAPPQSTASEVLQAVVTEYVGVLYALVNDSRATQGRGSLDSPRRSFEKARFCGLAGNSKLRTAVQFSWSDALLCPGRCSCHDSLFDLASLLLAAGLWMLSKAAACCRDQEVRTYLSVEVYKLLRQAAGLLAAAAGDVLPLLGLSPSLDCNAQVVGALSQHCLAEAQSVTVLRAIQKGNQAGLVAGLAGDTADLYRSALQALEGCVYSASGSGKLQAYLRYKEAAFRTYRMAFAATLHLDDSQAGRALRCVQEARSAAAAARSAAAAYDEAAPPTPREERVAFDAELSALLDKVAKQAERDNVAYMQHVPEELPLLPEPRRLVAVERFAWPPPAPLLADNRVDHFFSESSKAAAGVGSVPESAALAPNVVVDAPKPEQGSAATGEGAENGTNHDSGGGGSEWWRWLLVLFAAPVLLALTLVGAVVWIVLLPVKICCCPIGFAAQLAWDALEWLIKAPFRGLLWASGKPWWPDYQQRQRLGEERQQQQAGEKQQQQQV